GIRTAIVGRPNVGKSSMLNRLLGEERAIVTEIEGTTRDTLEEYVSIGGALLRLIDTAGIRETDDTVERIGVDKARDAIESADLILMLLDGTSSLTNEDREIISGLSGKEVIVLINKSDLSDASIKSDSTSHTTHTIIEENELTSCLQDAEVKGYHIINTSAKTGQGMEELTSLIGGLFFSQDIDYNNQVYVTRARHKNALTVARDSLGKVLDSIEAGLGEDFLTIDLMAAYESLGDIIGETLQDDLADKIFSEFCMGK
ncbi:MAG: GTPase, partial [Eubacterium sp.]|nr:GTPase [Eubacterium sp.]